VLFGEIVKMHDSGKGNGKVRPCTGCTAHRESGGIALLFLDHGTRRG